MYNFRLPIGNFQFLPSNAKVLWSEKCYFLKQFLFKDLSIFIWNVDFKERGGETEIKWRPSASSLAKWPQWLKLGWSKAWGRNFWISYVGAAPLSSGSLTGSGAAGTWTCTHMDAGSAGGCCQPSIAQFQIPEKLSMLSNIITHISF